MKKNLFIAAAVTVMAAVSCNKEQPQNDPQASVRDAVTFTAYVDGADTKTVLEGKNSLWLDGDGILAYGDGVNYKFSTSLESASAKAVFTLAEDVVVTGDKFIAVHPEFADGYRTSSADLNSKTLDKVYLKSEQFANIGSYDPDAAIAVAYTENDNLEFKNVNSLLKFTVKNEGVKNVTIYSLGGEALTGIAAVDYNAGAPVATPSSVADEANGWVELTAGDAVLEQDKEYYISVYPASLSGGFAVEFSFDGVTKIAVKKYEKSIDFKRNVILDLGDLEYVVEETTPGEASPWSVSGSFNEWGDLEMVTTSVADIFVAENVELAAYASLKIRKDKKWDENYGGGLTYLNPDNWMNVFSGGSDVSVTAAGTYDVYFDYTGKRLYVVTAGADYTTVPQQTENGPEPENEEPVVTADVLYMKPNSNWTIDGARFAAYFFNSGGNTWVGMTDSDGDGYYEVNIPEGYTFGENVIFCRMNPSTTANNWNNKWNQTADLVIPTDGTNCYIVADGTWDKGGGTWSTFTPAD